MPVAMASGEATILPCIAGACRDSVALLWLTCEENKWQRQTWTHQEVWQRACGAAQRLGRGRCGVAVDEGPLLPLLELAVLLAGGSIVPLDPCEPKGRLASVLEDSAPDQVVAKDAAGLANVELALEQVQGARPALILAEHLFADGPAACTEAPAIAGDAISHVFFTSGSTGKPKGCVVAHCALRSYCLAKNATYKLGAESVCLVASAHTFDPSLGDFMSTWAAGGCVALGPRSDFLQNLGPLLENSQATHLLCTPSLFATLGPRYEPSVLPSLRSVALGGEKMPPQMVKVWASTDGLVLSNTYGVTECCVYNATRQMLQDDSPAWLGNPLPGNVLLLQDTSRDELTDAEEGELAIAGAQVGEGYLKRPELTARQFQVHPEHGRLYLSGDLVRRSEGELQLLGRKDHQVKVRGHRIELTEVEHWLLQFAQPLVNSLAVACIEERLVAFCVPSPALSTTAVRRVLRAVLRFFSEKQVPRAMRPRFAWCDSLPLTGSGKVARHELSQLPVQEDSEDEEEERAPLQGLELRVAQIWAEELAQPLHRINKHSHFQELGGHSISALRVCRRLAVHLSSGEMSRDDDALGGDLGELTGPFAPLELLTRPKFQRYVQFLAEALGQDVDMAAEGQEEAEDEEGDGVELLHRAAAAGSVLLIGFLVGQGIPVDGHCSRKRLKAATRSQRSLQQTSKDGLRPPAPLHSAHGSPEATAALLQHNATVTATEAHGVMALHLAATKNAQVVQLLLDAKAPLAAKDLNQQTALHFAARAGCCESLAVLLRQWLADESIISQGARVYGGALDWRDRWHRTPVHWAVLNGHLQALKALLEARASAEPPKVREYRHVRSTTLRHESPLDIAQRLEPQMVAVLLQHGAVAA